MKEKTLFKIAICCTLVGIIILLYFSETIEIGEKEIDKINSEDIGKELKVAGEVVSVNNFDKVSFIKIRQKKYEDIDVILFKAGNISLQKGDIIKVSGMLEEYQGKLELVANEVSK